MARPRNVPSRAHTDAIGALVVAISELESIIIDLIGIAIGSKSILVTVAAFSPHQFSSKVDTLKALYSLGVSEEEFKTDPTIRKFQQARDLADFRNTVVHAYWSADADGTALAVRFNSRGYFKRTRTPVSVQEIRDKAREARALAKLLRGLREHLQKSRV